MKLHEEEKQVEVVIFFRFNTTWAGPFNLIRNYWLQPLQERAEKRKSEKKKASILRGQK